MNEAKTSAATMKETNKKLLQKKYQLEDDLRNLKQATKEKAEQITQLTAKKNDLAEKLGEVEANLNEAEKNLQSETEENKDLKNANEEMEKTNQSLQQKV